MKERLLLLGAKRAVVMELAKGIAKIGHFFSNVEDVILR
jgi:hypothetical protein